MPDIHGVTKYIHSLLNVDKYNDYCPNGMQISGTSAIKKIVSGVSANAELIARAIELKADILLVHHGLFWKGDNNTLIGVKKDRIRMLLENNINLLAYHLPLDIDPTYGNNVLLGRKLQWDISRSFSINGIEHLGLISHLSQPLSCNNLAILLEQSLNHKPIFFSPKNKDKINTVAWCSGAAEDGIEAAAMHGADAYISGEVSERTFHLAKELNIYYYAAGHHATECFGIESLGSHLAEKFSLHHDFINVYNPI